MPMKAEDIVNLITAAIPDARVVMTDLAGDGDHYQAEIYAPSFNGKSRIDQHKLVYAALGNKMGGELHALSIKTFATE
jgi:stress-induced morphogen